MVQSALSPVSPLQFIPPYFGAGFEQDLLRDFAPGPQLVEQVLHFDQADQPPSTIMTCILKKTSLLRIINQFMYKH